MDRLKFEGAVSSSFRDPSGFVFKKDGLIYRQINAVYKKDYDKLMNSGLYKALTNTGLLIPHEEVSIDSPAPDKLYKIIKPEPIPFISYPYEWCFSQLKDAALLTLEIQKRSLEFGMSLKDCSAYNVQFKNGRPIFIDTLSFEEYHEGTLWVAYKQFCKHFLAPLALMALKDIRLSKLLRVYIDGIPLDLVGALLPRRTHFMLSILTHLHLHARAQGHFSDKAVNTSKGRMTRLSFMGLIDDLERTVKNLRWKIRRTEWGDYYRDAGYAPEAFQYKRQVVSEYLNRVNPKIVWDLGANTGVFSRIAADRKIQVISFDVDPDAVEKNYLQCVADKETNILPIMLNLTNLSPGLGWGNEERMSLMNRAPADTALALALVHHLAISNNLPFGKIANFFNKICKSLIIEFIPKEDPQVRKLLLNRKDIFADYTKGAFETEFKKYFSVLISAEIKSSQRILYLMQKERP